MAQGENGVNVWPNAWMQDHGINRTELTPEHLVFAADICDDTSISLFNLLNQ